MSAPVEVHGSRPLGIDGRLARAAQGLGVGDVVRLGWLALFVVGYIPDFTYPSWSSRAILLAAIVPFGTWRLCDLAYRRDRAAVAFVSLLLVMLISSWVGGNAYESVLGGEPTGQSWIFWWSLAAAWSVGRTSTDAVRSLAAPVVVAAVGVHVAVATLQLTLEIESGPLAIATGRPSGLATNPVYFGALVAMCAVYSAGRSITGGQAGWGFATGLFALFVALSGSRAALVAMLIGLGAVALGERTKRITPPLSFAAGGLIAGTIIGATSGASSAAERTVGGSSGGRSDAWIAAWSSFLERPLLGWGPNRFRIAIQGRMPDEFVTAIDVGGAHAWTDPHNIVVSFVIGSGLIGAIAAAALVWQASVGADRLLLVCAGTIGLTWLLQPVFVVTGPVVFFLLGASKPEPRNRAGRPTPNTVMAVAVLAGAIWSATYVARDLSVARAPDIFAEAEAWRSYRRDPSVADALAERFALYALDGYPFLSEDSLSWAGRAVSYDSDRATWWARLAYWQLLFGDTAAADESSRTALRLQPNEPQAWLVRRALADVGSTERAEAEARVCVLAPDQC